VEKANTKSQKNRDERRAGRSRNLFISKNNRSNPKKEEREQELRTKKRDRIIT